MAKISRGKAHRSISWRVEGANRRRNFRQAHDGPEMPAHQSNKDTKRWCRGVVRREHRYVWFYNDHVMFCRWTRACEQCGKHYRK